jgi:hypothetical protein
VSNDIIGKRSAFSNRARDRRQRSKTISSSFAFITAVTINTTLNTSNCFHEISRIYRCDDGSSISLYCPASSFVPVPERPASINNTEE